MKNLVVICIAFTFMTASFASFAADQSTNQQASPQTNTPPQAANANQTSASQAPVSMQPATTQQQPDSAQNKMAAYKDLSKKLMLESSKIPGFTELQSKTTAIITNIGSCIQNGGDRKACLDKYKPDIKTANDSMMKMINDSINQGNTQLKTAYDNLNNFAKQNGLPPLH